MTQPPTDGPKISVVVASVNGPTHLGECLRALENQTQKDKAEVVVVDCCGDSIPEIVRGVNLNVKLLSFDKRMSIPELRAIGIKHSQGDIIALTEDHCLAEPHWFERMLRAHERHYGAIGGAVEQDPRISRLVDWAVFFCEYSKFMNPVPDGETADIPGNNISYRREFLAHVADLLDDGHFWESSLNGRLCAKGIKLYSDPSVVVYHKKEFRLGYYGSQRYHYSRSYAGMRTVSFPAWKRALYAAFTPLLPALLGTRIVVHVVGKKRRLGKLVRAFPLIAFFTIVWAWGELVGYLLGPGKSLSKVE